MKLNPRKPPKKAKARVTLRDVAAAAHGVGMGVKIEMEPKDAQPKDTCGEATRPSPWHRIDRYNYPQPTKPVLFYFRGEICIGMSVMHPSGGLQFCVFGVDSIPGFSGQAPGGPQRAHYSEYTHWRELPSELPR